MLIIEHLVSDSGERWRNIRLASLRDAPDAFGSTLADALSQTTQYWYDQIVDLATFVAVLDGVDVGIARGVPSNEISCDAYLVSMWVAPNARRRNVASKLIDAVSGWATAMKFSRLLLDVADINVAAMGLYKKKGFMATGETGTLPVPRDHITEFRMALELGEEPAD